MRKIVVMLCLLSLANMAMAQKTIKGKVYEPDEENSLGDNKEFVEARYYDVVLRKHRFSEEGLRIAGSDTAAFEFTLTKEQLRKYKFIEFGSFWGATYRVLKIKEIGPDSIDVILRRLNYEDDGEVHVYKPAIYLYPEQETAVSIKHTFKGTVLNTFPEYKDGWNVVASPDGKLKNKADGRSYNYLFWDGSAHFGKQHFAYKDGFYVSRKEIIPFLQQRLAQMGLNETEINDFIVYWLPALNKNETNFIHFWVNDDIDHSSKLEVEPKPETVIRVFMEYKAYDGKTPKLPEQQLPQTVRKGFVLVEWGGGAIGTSKVE
ncbi:hypothetical protein [Edaphocola aurantiacus]|uniref:hypothetical protein n=1 Tax=Edaphocola aurantiacus TaxID=2601682 RepID=UPI001C94CF91|nr:hypothetical protein [Edaphocola aurantiacus]